MFDFSWSEIALIVIVALVFIGPKDMPTAIRAVSRGLKAVRRMASEFQGHVDEMVREADLGEARDHLRDLKRFDFRDRIARTIDSDQTISKSLDFRPPPSLSAPASASVASTAPAVIPVSGPGVSNTETVPARQEEASAPAILPPLTARRLNHEKTLWHAPAVIPPLRVIHNGRRVALDPPPEAAPLSATPAETPILSPATPTQPDCPTAP
ncbi:twin-arginine translocase subunit TatB [Asaia siamensis]|uniref:Sec-independent protein translocase protein TatB n=1 Tax=Asaia siamensis TaxID=110479 RepID=A0ABQ1LT89_9PROT|nr:Sec-independent protein translocase protein TatB [Asaia siamensis]GBR04204.1 Sec-independent protein translocase TatB [Asaia siamensis NRIC 0323]GGC28592.1 Sec-independent protein translocase protein TatB [Asaia siamensis]